MTAAKAIWAVVWGLLALLAVVGSGRSPQALHDLVSAYTGQPGWLAHIDRDTASMFLHQGTTAAILLAVVCVVVAGGVFLPPQFTKATLVLGIVTFVFIWVATENFGGILAGGATDPNSGPPVIILALIYWPLTLARNPRQPDVELHGRVEGSFRPMTPTPAWLYYLFAVAMLAVAAYGLVLLAVSVRIRRSAAGTSTSPTSSWGCLWPACSLPAGPSARARSGSSSSRSCSSGSWCRAFNR